MNYTYQDLVSAYKSLGIRRGDTISLKTGLWPLGEMDTEGSDSLDLHIKALDKVLDFEKGTVVVASTSTNLCDTDIPFSLSKTPGTMGILTEKLRNVHGAVRSYHAFESYTAIGAASTEIFKSLSRHGYGIDTPEARLLEMDAKCVSLGLPVNRTCSIVHHLEMIAGVPYRYVREYHHPVERPDGEVVNDVFYRHPWYRKSDIKKIILEFYRQYGVDRF